MARTHGKYSTYTNGKCRCEKCRAANAEYARSRKRKSVKNGDQPPAHGTTNGYYNYSCRCEACKAAARVRRTSYFQNGLERPPLGTPCECCGKTQFGVVLRLDHNHETGEFRGWLCDSCNTGIGKLGDTIEGVKRALEYLTRAHP
ncbi:endonuclease [Microbacterium Phage DejaVu]|nr:endonuclease [Microbacterium Phage DejaVu]